ncbi:MAG: AAA family ATPase [Methanosarcinales archaeon]|nr:AAA family ATPase [Methanosarcinales archaeon]
MKIHTLQLHNFRKFKDNKFHFHPNFTVLIGDNASGKSSVLDALAVMLGTYIPKYQEGVVRGGIKKKDARLRIFEKYDQVTLEQQKPTFLNAHGTLHGKDLEWKRKLGDRGKDARNLTQIGEMDFTAVSDGEDVDLPVLLYYGTGRLWDVHHKVIIRKPESRMVGYRNCLDPKSDHNLFEKWFSQLELSALQKNKKNVVLEAVREATKMCIPGAKHFYYDVANGALMIELEEGYCLFDNLSDGYRNMVAMVADIAHRAARLNLHMGANAAKECSGVVLIDEIDLHLHPKWQRHVVGDLQKAFPNIQFIVTTHSPFILQSLDPGEVIDLNEINDEFTINSNQNIAEPSPKGEYSNKSIEDIIEDIMGIEMPQLSRRYQDMHSAAIEYYQVLQEAKNSDSQKKEDLKRKLDELSVPFSDNQAYHAFLEMERMAAGLGKSKKENK